MKKQSQILIFFVFFFSSVNKQTVFRSLYKLLIPVSHEFPPAYTTHDPQRKQINILPESYNSTLYPYKKAYHYRLHHTKFQESPIFNNVKATPHKQKAGSKQTSFCSLPALSIYHRLHSLFTFPYLPKRSACSEIKAASSK